MVNRAALCARRWRDRLDQFQSASRTPAGGCAESGRLQREDESDGLLTDDDTDQELSVRGGCCWRQPERGAGGSGKESRLAEETGQTQRDNIAG